LFQEKQRRERDQREKEERNLAFLLLGVGKKERRETKLAWGPRTLFLSPHERRKSEETVHLQLLPFLPFMLVLHKTQTSTQHTSPFVFYIFFT
jgi:hypothetical protein